jgi:hypothetical protein
MRKVDSFFFKGLIRQGFGLVFFTIKSLPGFLQPLLKTKQPTWGLKHILTYFNHAKIPGS